MASTNKLWDLRAGKEVSLFEGHEADVNFVKYRLNLPKDTFLTGMPSQAALMIVPADFSIFVRTGNCAIITTPVFCAVSPPWISHFLVVCSLPDTMISLYISGMFLRVTVLINWLRPTKIALVALASSMTVWHFARVAGIAS